MCDLKVEASFAAGKLANVIESRTGCLCATSLVMVVDLTLNDRGCFPLRLVYS